jgi:hypothetical protein
VVQVALSDEQQSAEQEFRCVCVCVCVWEGWGAEKGRLARARAVHPADLNLSLTRRHARTPSAACAPLAGARKRRKFAATYFSQFRQAPRGMGMMRQDPQDAGAAARVCVRTCAVEV